jgi:O-antigen ligase
LYGIYQYAAPPPWDAYWAQQENIESSQGATTAFNFRIFGTLNSTGPFADALMVALVLNLPRLSLRRWYVAVAFVPLTLALALTSVRACWVGLLVGIVAYFLVTPRRKKAALSLAAVAVVLAGAVLAATATVKESSIALTSLTDRLTTFSDLQNDRSASARGAETTTVLAESLDEPLGLGLGSSGTALKLAGQGAVGIDNGYLARFSEMGVVGFALFLAAVLAALVFALRSYSLARSRGDVDGLDLSALAVTFQAVFLAREVFADAHVAFTGMFFWAMVCASSEYGVVPLAAPALAAFDYDGLRRTERTR